VSSPPHPEPADAAHLLEAIRADPGDVGVRLAYSDWLEEHGFPERAEFIRVQIELATLPAADPRRQPLQEREEDLLARHEADWLGPPSPHLVEWTFRRGFVDRIALADTNTLASVEGLFARHPVGEVEWRNVSDLPRLVQSPLLERLTGLSLDDPLEYGWEGTREGLQAILETPRLAGLTKLSLWGDLAGDECLALLGHRPASERLRSLRLGNLSDAGASWLAAAPNLAGLTSLGIWPGQSLTDAGLATLTADARRWAFLGPMHLPHGGWGFASLARCERLTTLDLTWPAGYGACPPLPPALTHLEIYTGSQGQPPLPELARLECLPRLQHLELPIRDSGGRLGPEELHALGEILTRLPGPVLHLEVRDNVLPLAALSSLPGLDRLCSLVMWGTKLTDGDVHALAACETLTNLRRLSLPGKSLTARRVGMLGEAPFLGGLRDLWIRDAVLGDKGVQQLLASPRLTKLKRLGLGSTGMGAAGVEALAAWPGLPWLREVWLTDNPIDAAALRPLLQAPGLSPLVQVAVSAFEGGGRLTAEDVRPLQERHGHRFLWYDRD
jgi:uncharacterized protein (TIGR02996 family)